MSSSRTEDKYIVCWRNIRNGYFGRGKPIPLTLAKVVIDRSKKDQYSKWFDYWLEKANPIPLSSKNA